MSLPGPTADPRRAPLWRAVVVGCLLGASAATGTEIARMAFFGNAHTVVPGRLYRTAQLTPDRLAKHVERHGIKTVVNLRGRPFADWYGHECRATQALGISQEDVVTSAHRLPSAMELRRLVEVFDRSEHPVMIHCQQGADRTGLAAALYVLLYTDADYETARRQCSPRYGHFAFDRAAAMDEFFDLYEAWLATTNQAHTPAAARRWATEEYAPPFGTGRLELIDPPAEVPAGKGFVLRVRAYNTGREAWEMKAGSRVGVHVGYAIQRAPAYVGVFQDQAGFLDAVVPPGSSIDLELPVPPLGPGKYRLLADLSKWHVDFVKYGSEPLTYDWEARDPSPVRGR
ncbi:MAG TPA: tyrosine-protein phosphatase [Gemmataceae bacterium]|jgi:protein tyrosine phosphatase (PTP) superfamily phosphohydrolase (DUF442 family)|nr:tyrosine-protein phosphatase [Gemmataceae bacterium]